MGNWKLGFDNAVRFVDEVLLKKRTNLKILMKAIESRFKGISIVVIDTEQDTAIYGIEYIESQEKALGIEEG